MDDDKHVWYFLGKIQLESPYDGRMPENKTMVLAASGPLVLYAEGSMHHKHIDTDTIHLRNQSAGGCTVYQVGVQDVEKSELIHVMNVPAKFVDPNSTIVLYEHGIHEGYRNDNDFNEVFYSGIEHSPKTLIFKILTSMGKTELRLTVIPFYPSHTLKFRIDLPEVQDAKSKA